MNKTVVITGAYGFIGRHVSKLYAEHGWQVIGIGHGNWPLDEYRQWGVHKWINESITIEKLKDGVLDRAPQTIIHCAGSSSVIQSINEPYIDYRRTVDSTLSVLEFARLYLPSTKIVYTSSAAVYGSVDHMPINENIPLNPISPYGFNKVIAEDLCRMYATVYKLPIAIVRIFSAYGVGLRKQLIWDACCKLSRGGDVTFSGSGLESRDWIHVEDIASLVYVASKQADVSCPICNGGTGIGTNINQILNYVFRFYGKEDKPIFTGAGRTGDPTNYQADISNALKWGWFPRVDLLKALEKYVLWFKEGAP